MRIDLRTPAAAGSSPEDRLFDAIAERVADRVEAMIRDSASFQGIGPGELIAKEIAAAVANRKVQT